MKDVILTTDLYHKHADPNDHWNLATMYSLAYQGFIRFAGIMCDDDRSIREDGSFLHFGDPSVQSVAQLNYITGMAVPVGIGSRRPIKKKEDLDEVLKAGDRISSVTLLLDTLQRSESKVDIHMCGSCKDVLIAYKYAPELFEKKCDSIYLNAGTYVKQDPIEYNVSLEPYAYSQIFKIPCNICWGPCFDEIRHPFLPSQRATFYRVDQREILPYMSERIKKYLDYMYGVVFDKSWLTYLREPLEENFFDKWIDEWTGYNRQMWSTPGYLLSAGKVVTPDGRIVDAGTEQALYAYKPINVEVDENGYTKWEDTEESNVKMFQSIDAELYYNTMTGVIQTLFKALP